ncbi:MAG: tRNA (adenosine(37)-N6)-threonylcarbamoyltransferase complex transferase subunit TsaD [Phycisphaerales bacterium]|nr:MAG: tRNA (adenosine(37)-N6)-threonylcarbamoyltransferase complex transferase subunit TsaD [Phycisphaerales bacterium]
MSQREPLILGIESSCDETAAAVVRGGREVLSNIIATQHELHEPYAGVVPEIASRAHIERILPTIREAVREAGLRYEEIDAIAVGHRPGLIGSLLVGVSAAKALAWSLDKPLIGVDHIHAHLYAGLLEDEPVTFPALGLVVSGGHTSLFLMKDFERIRVLGRTIDDAIGEAYDKAATILQLGYPGGPRLDKLAQLGDDEAYELPVSMLERNSLDFSFSGLKTALLYAVCGKPEGRGSSARMPRDASSLSDLEKADFAASFQRAAAQAIVRKLRRAFKQHKVKTLLTGGGVTANSRLRHELEQMAAQRGLDLRLPRMEFCLDNAAMIAGLAAERYRAGAFDDWTLAASPRSETVSS